MTDPDVHGGSGIIITAGIQRDSNPSNVASIFEFDGTRVLRHDYTPIVRHDGSLMLAQLEEHGIDDPQGKLAPNGEFIPQANVGSYEVFQAYLAEVFVAESRAIAEIGQISAPGAAHQVQEALRERAEGRVVDHRA